MCGSTIINFNLKYKHLSEALKTPVFKYTHSQNFNTPHEVATRRLPIQLSGCVSDFERTRRKRLQKNSPTYLLPGWEIRYEIQTTLIRTRRANLPS